METHKSKGYQVVIEEMGREGGLEGLQEREREREQVEEVEWKEKTKDVGKGGGKMELMNQL